jgi:hypothetical protein
VKITRLFASARTYADVNAAVRAAQAQRIRGNGKLRDQNLRRLAACAIVRIRTHEARLQQH